MSAYNAENKLTRNSEFYVFFYISIKLDKFYLHLKFYSVLQTIFHEFLFASQMHSVNRKFIILPYA